MANFTTLLLAASAAASAVGGIQGYMQNQEMAKAEKSRFAANKRIAEQQAEIDRKRLRREQLQQQGTATVAAASSGSGISSYSDLFQEDLQQQAMDMALVDYNAALDIEGMRFESEINQSQYKSAATSSLISGISGAASSGVKAYNASDYKAKKG